MKKFLILLFIISFSCSGINHNNLSCKKKHYETTNNKNTIYIRDFAMKTYGRLPISFIQVFPDSTVKLTSFEIYFKKRIYNIRKWEEIMPKSSIDFDEKGNLLFNHNKYFTDKYFKENIINTPSVFQKISDDFWNMSNVERFALLDCYNASK